MKTVLVTGAKGFIGKNLCVTLEQRSDVELLKYDIDNNMKELREHVQRADFVFHLAGVNRPKDVDDFDRGNRGFTQTLVDLLEGTGRIIPLVITSSIQAGLDNPYGKSKRAAEEAVFDWSCRTGTDAYIYRLPNVFGKWCKPNYNSVVATFCHNIARGMQIRIDNPRTKLTLVYIDDVVKELIRCLEGHPNIDDRGFGYVPRTFKVTLEELADTLYEIAGTCETLIVPNLAGELERYLYATYTTYLPKISMSYELDMKQDNRGWLAEFIKSRQFGQIFVSKTKPGITRGNHWHHTKIEKFLVIDGEAVVRLRKIGADEVIQIRVSGGELRVVDIPAGYIHSITNIGDRDLITLFWADEIFDPNRPDTYYLEV